LKNARICTEYSENEFREVERLRGMKCFPGSETQFVGNTMSQHEPALPVDTDACQIML